MSAPISKPTFEPPDPPAVAPTEMAFASASATLTAYRREAAQLREALAAAELRERELAHELQHRVRNILSVIRSIYRRTREKGASHDEFAEHFQGRLDVIAKYYGDVAGSPAGGVELEDMVRDELFKVAVTDGPRCRIAGPSIRLRNKPAELLGLALHELTTNAIKFGALYNGGTLSVDWDVAGAPTGRILHLRWAETGVSPLSAAPRPRGFGQDLIEDALPFQLGAKTSFAFRSGGFDCSIEVPLSEVPEPLQVDLDAVGDAIPGVPSGAERAR